MKKRLTISQAENTYRLLKELSGFSRNSLNKRTQSNTWSAADISEQLLLFDSRQNTILKGETLINQRNVNKNNPVIIEGMTDKSAVIEAPEFLVPSTTNKVPTLLIKCIHEFEFCPQYLYLSLSS